MKLYHKEIHGCGDCPFARDVRFAEGEHWICTHSDTAEMTYRERVITILGYSLPPWCPLPDAEGSMRIQIDNLTKAQEIALEDMMATWVHLGGIGSSRWTAFFADGDGNFRPNITVNGKKPEFSNLVNRTDVWAGDEYRIDFDSIAWKLREAEGEK